MGKKWKRGLIEKRNAASAPAPVRVAPAAPVPAEPAPVVEEVSAPVVEAPVEAEEAEAEMAAPPSISLRKPRSKKSKKLETKVASGD